MKPSLETIQKLCNEYNDPQNAFKTVHVAGTNGKGSVCTKIAKALEIEGYKVGLYTSPHITSFQERIQINGKPIKEEEIQELLSITKDKTSQATFFEVATLLGFLYFQKHKVDIAVIEAGLGGRFDATNVITPLISVITSIGYDHIEILGSSLEEIAYEKAGIIKKNTPLILGPDAYYPCMEALAKQTNSPLYQNEKHFADFDKENQETARLSLEVLRSKIPISSPSILQGLEAKPPCRFESYDHKKTIILDVAHNSHGFAKLITSLESTYPECNYRFIVGFSKGKDLKTIGTLIQRNAAAVHLVTGSHPRLASIEEIATALPSLENTIKEKSIKTAITNALNAPSYKKEIIVIAGSFFIMEEVKEEMKLIPY